MRAAAVAAITLAGALAPCSWCERARPPQEAPELMLPVHPTPVLPDVTFRSWRNDSTVALPRGCVLEPPMLRARIEGAGLRFSLSPEAPGELALAYRTGAEAAVPMFAHGIVSLQQPRAPRDITWFDQARHPFLAATAGRWMALVEAPGEASPRQLILAREGAADERLAAGDQLHGADLWCKSGRCAALTSKVGSVAGPGASLFTGAFDAPAASWARTDIAAEQKDAAPLAITDLDAAGVVSLVVTTPDKATHYQVSGGQATAGDSLPTQFGPMDAALVHGKLLLARLGSKVDERGCSGTGGTIEVQASGAEPHRLQLTAPPRGAMLRPLASGAVLAWLSPVNCLNPDRWIVYAVLVDASGKPSSSPMAVADAAGFAMSTDGQDRLELALDTPDGAMVLRAKCTP